MFKVWPFKSNVISLSLSTVPSDVVVASLINIISFPVVFASAIALSIMLYVFSPTCKNLIFSFKYSVLYTSSLITSSSDVNVYPSGIFVIVPLCPSVFPLNIPSYKFTIPDCTYKPYFPPITIGLSFVTLSSFSPRFKVVLLLFIYIP